MRYQPVASSLDVSLYLPKIIARKHLKARAVLQAAQLNVINLCKSYAKALGKLSSPNTQIWSEELATALKSCYTVNTEELSSHKDAILAHLKLQSEVNVQRCAYCMLNDPKTWDHYMPKDEFPEYAVFHENLVYICYGCNQRKSNYFDKNKLIYCHPYFTVDCDEALLHCRVMVEAGKLSIRYYGAGHGKFGMNGKIVEEHLTRLGLVERYKGEAAGTVNSLIGELRQYYPHGVTKAALDAVLERRFEEARQKLGCNAWDSRLWHGLAACPDFLAYANDKIIQPGVPSSSGFRISSPAPPP